MSQGTNEHIKLKNEIIKNKKKVSYFLIIIVNYPTSSSTLSIKGDLIE